MSLEQNIADLTASTTALTEQVLETKSTADAAKYAAQTSATNSANSAAASAASAAASQADRVLAQDAATTAQTAEANAVAVVTGGTASLTAEAGKIPIADANGYIDQNWMEGGVATAAQGALADTALQPGASPTILAVDPLRKAVESESGGRQTIIYTAKGQPSWMYVLPKFNMEDIPGWTAGTGTHPAFIANGVEQSEIMVGVYQAAEIDGEAVSQPGLYPRVSINYDQSRALCQANGAGHDIMSIWDWAAIALWCMANGFQPRGNTNYGRHHDNKWETGIVPDGATLGSDATGITNTKTGSGPNSWNHDNSPGGIADLVGNVWEWLYGMKILDGVVQLAPDNGDYTEAQYTNTGFTLPSNRTWATIDATGAPDSLKQALIVPNGVADPLGYHYINLTGERLPYRGGTRSNAGTAGLAAVYLNNSRARASSNVGFRPRFRNP